MHPIHRRPRRLAVLAVAAAAGVASLALPPSPAGATAAAGCDGSWRAMPSPSPGGDWDTLMDVDALSRSDAWAVGYAVVDGEHRPLAQRWDGTSWKTAPIRGGTAAVLTGVTMLATDDVFAVGYVSVGLTETRPYALRWDGLRWNTVPVPRLRMGTLTAVHGTGQDNLWAVGMVRDFEPSTLALRWDGTEFVRAPTPAVEADFVALGGVVAMSGNSAWAVGYAVDAAGRNRPLSVHWDGTRWSRVRVPDLGTEGSALEDVTVTDTGEAWAVGWRTSEAGTGPIALRRFDGVWSQPATVFGEASRFQAVAPLPGGGLVAVGFEGGPDTGLQAITEVYDGAWQVVPAAPVPGDELLFGVATVPGRDVSWAVGQQRADGVPRTLIERRCA